MPKAFVNLISEENVAIMLVHARGSHADRDRLVELARRWESKPPKDDAPMQCLEPPLTAALAYAAAGREAEARRLLPGEMPRLLSRAERRQSVARGASRECA